MMVQDMCSTVECKRSIEETIEKLGGIDIVIANAVGVYLSFEPLDMLLLKADR
jgi:NAD(P)-dependent dehydrogenase (short-subunit alcohol dehydrogenase family)